MQVVAEPLSEAVSPTQCAPNMKHLFSRRENEIHAVIRCHGQALPSCRKWSPWGANKSCKELPNGLEFAAHRMHSCVQWLDENLPNA